MDEFVVMPNHIHGIIHIVRKNNLNMDSEPLNKKRYTTNINSDVNLSSHQNETQSIIRPHGTKPQSLSMRKINRIRKVSGVKLWQRDFYEHIIRNRRELNRIRFYIVNNPAKWYKERILS